MFSSIIFCDKLQEVFFFEIRNVIECYIDEKVDRKPRIPGGDLL
ncbi:MAG: hypothetical protein UZ01_02210 [Candidatus Brocadia sinica]|nr:MAG: hypothetical protein UZ01_02210 [Candidatus Brocadia sinica]